MWVYERETKKEGEKESEREEESQDWPSFGDDSMRAWNSITISEI